MKKKILIVFGTRPEAIKMAPVVNACRIEPSLQTFVCVTAQHRQMLDQVLELFEIEPDYDLDVMQDNQDLYDITTGVLLGMRGVLRASRPDIVLVHGDTSTTFAATLAAFYEKIDVGHVEAGLRTGNLYSPWPEEANRKLTAQIACLHFAPTMTNKNNLLHENIPESQIYVTGNTVIDALLYTVERIEKDISRRKRIEALIAGAMPEGVALDVRDTDYILVTGHRRENFGQGFLQICEALAEIARRYPRIAIIYPVHLNPQVRKPVFDILSDFDNIYLIEPLAYEPFVYLMKHARLVLTDSGGIQEEAPALGKPVLVMRDTTERPEALEAGTVKLVGTDTKTIVNTVKRVLEEREFYETMCRARNPYGNGDAAQKIVEILKYGLYLGTEESK